jgi:hypothetical protein
MHPTTLAAIGILAVPAIAQTAWYSPAGAAAAEQNAATSLPWSSSTARWQQVHADLRGAPRALAALGLRRDGAAGTVTAAVARTATVELALGHGALAGFGATFADNYADVPVVVFDPKPVNLPAWVAPQGAPAPWSLQFAFDRPFAYDGAGDLVWELLVHATTAAAEYPADAFLGSGATGNGSQSTTGTGCNAWNSGGPVAIAAAAWSNPLAGRLELHWRVRNTVAVSLTAVFVGTGNPNLPLPELCANLQVDGIFHLVLGNSDGAGRFATPVQAVTWDPVLAGVRLHAQAGTIDHWQTVPVQLALSNGAAVTVAPLAAQPGIRRAWAGDVTAARGDVDAGGNAGGLAIRLLGQ